MVPSGRLHPREVGVTREQLVRPMHLCSFQLIVTEIIYSLVPWDTRFSGTLQEISPTGVKEDARAFFERGDFNSGGQTDNLLHLAASEQSSLQMPLNSVFIFPSILYPSASRFWGPEINLWNPEEQKVGEPQVCFTCCHWFDNKTQEKTRSFLLGPSGGIFLISHFCYDSALPQMPSGDFITT